MYENRSSIGEIVSVKEAANCYRVVASISCVMWWSLIQVVNIWMAFFLFR